ncbi:MAG: helix-turn-helix transcriptional regulator [Dehalococcoidia bacterium]|nr:helix-turn-helix transcriptional regulator [Dehalococcoidia bacterium]
MSTARAVIYELDDDGADVLTPAQYAILGLLEHTPAHGYQLQRSFAPDGDLTGVLPLEQASLYGALKELANQGLIQGVEAREGLRPPKTVYQLTPDGRRLLASWLKRPVERLRQVRLDFLLKIYFTRKHGRRAVRSLVDAQVSACHEYLSQLEARAAEIDPDDFVYLVIESRTSAARSTLDWLREYRRRL